MTTSNPLICIVDDAVDYRLLLKPLFSRYFPAYSVVFFTDGAHFLNELPQLAPLPDLILLDRHMPILDGNQTLLRLKAHPVYKGIPVVMVSNDASASEIHACYDAGANSFMLKPIEFNLLKEQLGIVCQYWLELKEAG